MPAILRLVFHGSALVPLLALILLGRLGREVPVSHKIVALGFSVSFFADTAGWMLTNWEKAGLITHAELVVQSAMITHIYPSIQIALFGAAFASIAAPIAATAALAFLVGGAPEGPEVLVTFFGSIAIVALSMGHELRWPMIAYCGLATFFFMLVVYDPGGRHALAFGYSYHVSRVVAYGLFIHCAFRRPQRIPA